MDFGMECEDMKEKELTHFNKEGVAYMVDIKEKKDSHRKARAAGRISMEASTLKIIQEGSAKKGDVLGVARLAGIQATKQTSHLIPLCHLLPLTKVEIDFILDEENPGIEATCTTECVGKTGVEMEALTGVTVALLTIYDMCKAVDKNMEIERVHLVEKLGGQSGHYRREG